MVAFPVVAVVLFLLVSLLAQSTAIPDYDPFPAQTEDVSYGIDSNAESGFFSSTTPGGANGVRGSNNAETSVAFNVTRGFYSSRIDLALSADGQQIRYTLDGSAPDGSSPLYSATIPITTSTVVRAASTSFPTNVVTHSYIFLKDVLQQSAETPGFPNGEPILVAREGGGRPQVPFDTEMDPTIINEYPTALQALEDIPSMILTSSLEDWFGPDGV